MSRSLVIDASVMLTAILGDEPASAPALAAVRQLTSRQGLVPGLWSCEVGNVLVARERRGRIDARQLDALLAGLEALPLQVDHQGLGACFRKVIELARKHRLSTYDALYLELALRERAALATLDEALAAAAAEERVELALARG
ncbi:MAG: type II toxin-antitoxin system VapC family toxin [Planctomycetes bacterium]|nr:type II toxin-antitoxin system VapC family toxin [Planctomycetota bacterium]